ncbi:MAG: 30S ribosome-binding factor RbfA [Gammaproteobacteria bacterium]|nr:30S ribosome-binding factor RbfA [Gammaproteobacteria bacterium]
MESGRDLRVGDFIRDELAAIILREMRDPRVGMVNVNEVRVSRDLSYADVYVSSIDAATDEAREQLIDVLNKASGFFRSKLAKRHSMRTTPKLRIHYDQLIEEGPRLEALIERAVRSDEQLRDAGGEAGSEDDHRG